MLLRLSSIIILAVIPPVSLASITFIGTNNCGGVACAASPTSPYTVTGTAALVVGTTATGALSITSGSIVNDTTGTIGSTGTGIGTVTVDGSGSQWNSSGTVRVGGSGTGTLNVQNGGAVTSAGADIAFGVSGIGVATVTGSGSSWVNTGTLRISNLGSATLTVSNNATFTNIGTFNLGDNGVGTLTIDSGAVVTTNGNVTLGANASGSGTLNLYGTAGSRGVLEASRLLKGGGIAAVDFNGGILRANSTQASFISSFTTLELNISSGGLFIDSNGFDIGTSNVFSGVGGLTKQGTGVLTLSGNNVYTGATTVNAGTLLINGNQTAATGLTTVNTGGILGGTGTIGGSVSIAGGTIAPGASIGTLRIRGNYTQSASSTYQVEINSAGQTDLIDIDGTASVAGTVDVVKAAGAYSSDTIYTILHADGGVTGTYSTITENTPFLNFGLTYDSNNVYLSITRNEVPLSALPGITPNEKATADAITSLGAGNPVYTAVVNVSTQSEAEAAYNHLSGEIYASTVGALLEESRYLRYAILNRLWQTQADDTQLMTFLNAPWQTNPFSHWTFWADGIGAWGKMQGNGNAATLQSSTGGFFLGADHPIGEAFRVGVLTGYSRSTFDVQARTSETTSNNYYLGMYGDASFNPWRLRYGWAYAWDTIGVTRQASLPGFNNQLTSNVTPNTAQYFAEAAYHLAVKRIILEPFANIAGVNISNDQWSEDGGVAALQGSGKENVLYSTLGIRELTKLYKSAHFIVSNELLLGWQHAFYGLNPQVTQQFVSGGTPFIISGAPIAAESLLINAGLSWMNTAKTLHVKLAYMGQLAKNVTNNGVIGTISYQW